MLPWLLDPQSGDRLTDRIILAHVRLMSEIPDSLIAQVRSGTGSRGGGSGGRGAATAVLRSGGLPARWRIWIFGCGRTGIVAIPALRPTCWPPVCLPRCVTGYCSPPGHEQRLLLDLPGPDTMTEKYMVQITKDHLVFSAAHFITYAGDICERLHGHNYRVQLELEGPLDENQYVIDFIVLRDTLKEVVEQLDHHVLLPTSHPQIKVTADEQEVEAVFENRRWLFPRCDVVLLPVANTTTELLARHIGLRLLADLAAAGQPHPARLRIGVDENFGQWGFWEWRGDQLPPVADRD